MAQRIQLTVDVVVPQGQTPRDVVDWVQRYFSYFHKSYDPKIDTKSLVVQGSQPIPETPKTETQAEDLL